MATQEVQMSEGRELEANEGSSEGSRARNDHNPSEGESMGTPEVQMPEGRELEADEGSRARNDHNPSEGESMATQEVQMSEGRELEADEGSRARNDYNPSEGESMGTPEIQMPEGRELEADEGNRARNDNHPSTGESREGEGMGTPEVQMPAGRELEADEGTSAARNDNNPSPPATSARTSPQIETTQDPADTRNAPDKLWMVLFLAHLIIILIVAVLFAVLTPKPKVYLMSWYAPLLASNGLSYIVACAWLLTSLIYPGLALRASFCLGPLLNLAVGIYFFTNHQIHHSLAAGLAATLAGSFLTLYACCAWDGIHHAHEILAVSRNILQPTRGILNPLLVPHATAAFIYCSVWTHCVGGIAIIRPRYSAAYISMLSLSLAWTMQVIRNTAQVATVLVERRVYTQPSEAFQEACTRRIGSISLGSALVPVIGVLWGVARSLQRIAGEDCECGLFSLTTCGMWIADRLMGFGNWWGFVLVAVENKGIMEASRDTWQMFKRLNMEPVIDSDLTSSFCFMCGMTGAAISALVGAFLVVHVSHKNNAVEIASCAFFVGYYMSRIAMALPQACVSTYHVAYAENPQGDTIIRNRFRALQDATLLRRRS